MISQEKIEKILEIMKKTNESIADLAKALNVKDNTARRYVRLAKEYKRDGTSLKVPKILLFDVETATMKIETWGILYKQRPQPYQILEEWFCLSWSAKWLFDDKIMSDIVTSEEALKRNDSRILKSIWDLLEESDICIGHNSDRFDHRKLNARFIKHKMIPPMPYKSIDTLKIAKKHFAFSSYSLEYLCHYLGLTPKLKTDYSLWRNCLAGDRCALDDMEKYNKRDVLALEELYIEFLPWIKSHPNLALYMNLKEPLCSNCGSSNLEWKGFYYTPAGRFKSGRCRNCNAIFRSRYSDLSKEERRNLLMGVAK